MPTQVCLLHLAAEVDLELVCTGAHFGIEKEVQPVKDDGNVIRVADSNRSQITWNLTCLLTTSDLETLKTYYRSATVSGYPKLRIYDKSTDPYYNEYGVYFAGLDCNQITPGKTGRWTVKLNLAEKTIVVS